MTKKFACSEVETPRRGDHFVRDGISAITYLLIQVSCPRVKACANVWGFDYRSHIAYALGILGGSAAEETLRDLSRNDPFPAVHEQAGSAQREASGR